MQRYLMTSILIAMLAALLVMIGGTATAAPAATPTSFTYQGRLGHASTPVNGLCDLRFTLFDAASAGIVVGEPVTHTQTAVRHGLFVVELDFGVNAFTGAARFLQIAARCPSGNGDYIPLTPRQPLTAAPYALYAYGTSWSGLLDIPAEIADGDDDTLAALQCSQGEGARWNGAAWVCADLSGPPGPSGAQGPPGVQGLQGPAGAPGPQPARIVWVAKSGGDFTSVSAALAAITDASATHRTVIKIAPGVYTETVTLKSYVDLEGSGQAATVLRGLGGSENPLTGGASATLRASGAITAEVRRLSVESVAAGATFAAAIRLENVPAGSLQFSHVRTQTSGGLINYGFVNLNAAPRLQQTQISVTGDGDSTNIGMINHFAAMPLLQHTTVTVTGGQSAQGLYNVAASAAHLNHVTIHATGALGNSGIHNTNSEVTIRTSEIVVSGGVGDRRIELASGSARVANTLLDGTVEGNGFACIGAYSATFAPLNNECK